MGFNASLITFSPNTLMKSADVNSNFNAINNAGVFSGTLAINNSIGLGVTIASGSNIIWSSSGTCSGLNAFNGNGAGTFNHGLSVTPNSFSLCYNVNINPGALLTWHTSTSTTIGIAASANNWFGLARAN